MKRKIFIFFSSEKKNDMVQGRRWPKAGYLPLYWSPVLRQYYTSASAVLRQYSAFTLPVLHQYWRSNG